MSPSVEKGAANDIDRHKREAAERAVESMQPGMVVGLGTGSTAAHVVHRLAALRSEGKLLDVKGVPTSHRTAVLAESLGIPLTTLEAHPVLDLCIDGADEVDPELRLIKGGGGALLREKIVAQASRRVIIVVDEGKLSPRLGTRWAVPVEVLPFGWRSQALYLEGLGARVTQRLGPGGSPFVTDQGHFILDCAWGALEQPEALAARLQARAGIVEHGLFLGLTSELIVAGSGGVEVRHPG
ncbi:ribose-5-phosphate isomerase [Cystobacter fuscus]|uniref:Ribose-5-phosphate isomerase A n=1 Tax=Cystobacter fuscus TaxID=43 RepID=A0A250IXN4_9BACT|nr:ribose-5-phosphate isomerase RpiA [Cystobacter fuscus]ATB35998.1 ribose-5-phosphate isomerase [Cystobacter fuscus]